MEEQLSSEMASARKVLSVIRNLFIRQAREADMYVPHFGDETGGVLLSRSPVTPFDVLRNHSGVWSPCWLYTGESLAIRFIPQI